MRCDQPAAPLSYTATTHADAMTCLFVEQLTVIDCAYLHAQRGLVGESWIVDIELAGALDAQSMVLDFGAVKKQLKRAIDQSVDHTLLVPKLASGLEIHQAGGQSHLWFRGPAAGPIEHLAPEMAVSLLDSAQIDTDALRDYLLPHLAAVVPANVAEIRLGLRQEKIDGAFYHYTHGLKKHAGQCQRIAHGHRSRIEIRIDGKRDNAEEIAWAERWRDIYLGTIGDRVSSAVDGRSRFEYLAQEGRFALELPASRCDLLDGDTTVERIAEHLAARIAQQHPGREIEVRAYEGVMKGALARAGV
jgi:6-pyruvoyl-tetrahydropterin synthase